MQGDSYKVFFGALLFSLIIIAGFIFWQVRSPEVSGVTDSTEISGILITPETSDWGQISINGGVVTREFELKNTTEKTVKLKKVATSCMCTQASVEAGGASTRFFGMEMAGDRNPAVSLEISAGETGKIIIKFDPAAHGPQGIGPFEREVVLTFSDPVGVKTIKFNGEVTK